LRDEEELAVLGFEIWKNGEKIAVAGLKDSGAVSFMLTWVGKGAGASERALAGAEIAGLDLRVGGIDSSDPAGDRSVEWIEDTGLRIGDELSIKLVAAPQVDAPARSETTESLASPSGGHHLSPCTLCGGVRLVAANPTAAE
jgi:hypothetical protein